MINLIYISCVFFKLIELPLFYFIFCLYNFSLNNLGCFHNVRLADSMPEMSLGVFTYPLCFH